jgi:hypothetical protein
VAAVSSTLDDLPIIDAAVADFEAASGALLNRNRKTVIVGLGSWAGRLDWPLQWIGAAPSVKIYGVMVAPTFAAVLQQSWDRVIGKFEAVLRMWTARASPPF